MLRIFLTIALLANYFRAREYNWPSATSVIPPSKRIHPRRHRLQATLSAYFRRRRRHYHNGSFAVSTTAADDKRIKPELERRNLNACIDDHNYVCHAYGISE